MRILEILLGVFLVAFIILALLPWYHETIQASTEQLDPALRAVVHFMIDPLDYVWKWIVALLIAVVAFITRQ